MDILKQAILISAYKDLEFLLDIVDHFDEKFEFYIHIDRKSRSPKRIVNALKLNPKVRFVTSYYNVNWGGLNHVNCVLLMMKEALKQKDVSIFHFISGHDFPIKSADYFTKFFRDNRNTDYLEYFTMPSTNWENGGMDRLQLYHVNDFLDLKKHKKWYERSIRIQQKLKVKRRISPKLPPFYGGSAWWSLTRESLQYVVDFTQNFPQLFKRMRFTFCSEEMYFQTVLLNSPLRAKIKNENLRYIDWTFRNGHRPAILDISDLTKIQSGPYLFARKFGSTVSMELKSFLQNH